MTTTQSNGNGVHHALVKDDVLVLHGFRETDPTVVRLVAEADDPEAVVHHCLGLGARTAKLAEKTLDTEMVQQAFDGMRADMEHRATEAFSQLGDTLGGFLNGDDGVLAKTLAEGREELERSL